MRFCTHLNGSVFQPGLIHRRKYDAPACFDVWIAASERAMLFEKLKNKLADRSGIILSIAAVAIVLLLPGTGCGLRKVVREQQRLVLNESNAHYADSLALERTASRRAYQRQGTDSISTAFTLEIWPSGPFSFNSDKGFEGSAEKVLVHGHSLALLRSAERSEAQENKSSLASSRKQQKQQQSMSKKQAVLQKNPAWKWALMVFSIAIAAVLLKQTILRSQKYLL